MADQATEPRVKSLRAMSDGLNVLESSLALFCDLHDEKGLQSLPQARDHLTQARRILEQAKHCTGLD